MRPTDTGGASAAAASSAVAAVVVVAAVTATDAAAVGTCMLLRRIMRMVDSRRRGARASAGIGGDGGGGGGGDGGSDDPSCTGAEGDCHGSSSTRPLSASASSLATGTDQLLSSSPVWDTGTAGERGMAASPSPSGDRESGAATGAATANVSAASPNHGGELGIESAVHSPREESDVTDAPESVGSSAVASRDRCRRSGTSVLEKMREKGCPAEEKRCSRAAAPAAGGGDREPGRERERGRPSGSSTRSATSAPPSSRRLDRLVRDRTWRARVAGIVVVDEWVPAVRRGGASAVIASAVRGNCPLAAASATVADADDSADGAHTGAPGLGTARESTDESDSLTS